MKYLKITALILSQSITENITLYVEGIDGTKTIVSEGEETVEEKKFFVVKGFKMKGGKDT